MSDAQPKYVPRGAPREKREPCNHGRGDWACGGWGKYPDPNDPTKKLCFHHAPEGRAVIGKRTKDAHARWRKGKAERDAKQARETRCITLLAKVPDEMLHTERFEKALRIAINTVKVIER